MPFLVSILMMIASSLVARVLFALGMTYVIFSGLDQLNAYILGLLNSFIGYLPAEAAMVCAKFGLFTALSVVVSAYLASLSLISAMVGAKRLIMTGSSS